MLPVVCQDEWYGGDMPQDITLDDAQLVRDEKGDPKVVVTVSADVGGQPRSESRGMDRRTTSGEDN